MPACRLILGRLQIQDSPRLSLFYSCYYRIPPRKKIRSRQRSTKLRQQRRRVIPEHRKILGGIRHANMRIRELKAADLAIMVRTFSGRLTGDDRVSLLLQFQSIEHARRKGAWSDDHVSPPF